MKGAFNFHSNSIQSAGQRRACLKAGLPLGDDADLLGRDRAMSGGDAAAKFHTAFHFAWVGVPLHAGRKKSCSTFVKK
jgi:hypothetical protein